MEKAWELPTQRSAQRRPLYVLAGLLGVCGLSLLFAQSFLGLHVTVEPLILAGALVWVLTFIEVRIGFALLIFSVALSPEYTLFGIPNIRLEDFLFPAVFTAWLTKTCYERRSLVRTDLQNPVLLFLFLSLVSTLYNLLWRQLPAAESILRLGKIFEFYLMFFLALNIPKTSRDTSSFIHMLWIAAFLVALYSTVQLKAFKHIARVSGPPGETANILGGYLLFSTCLLLGIGCLSSRWRLISLVVASATVLPFVYTLSRGTYVAFFVAMLVLAILTRKPAALLVLLLAASLVLFTQARDRFATIFGIISGNPPSSWAARVGAWKFFLPQALNAPLLGYGIGKAPLWVDNEYVRVIYEVGLLGFLAFCWILVGAARTALQVARKVPNHQFRGFAYGYLAGLAGLVVHSITATSFTAIRTTEPFLIATGLLCAIAARSLNLKKETQQAPLPS